MADVVVTVPMTFTHPAAPGKRGLAAWVAEGDPAGEPWSGIEWEFTLGGSRPPVSPGDRVYVVCEGRLRGYAPLIRCDCYDYRSWVLVRGGGAVAVTIDERIKGFRGWRYRWWERNQEIPFPDWEISNADIQNNRV